MTANYTYVDFVRDDKPRTGDSSELCLCEQWTAGPKCVFQFDVQGQVATSTHAGFRMQSTTPKVTDISSEPAQELYRVGSSDEHQQFNSGPCVLAEWWNPESDLWKSPVRASTADVHGRVLKELLI